MSFFEFNNIEIAGVSSAVPRNRVEVDSFISDFGDETVQRFKKSVGVARYHKTLSGQTASDLGFAAAEELLAKLSFDRSKIGLLTFVSLSPDYLRPATACVLQHRLKLESSTTAFDIGMGCSGFVYGLQVTASIMQNSDVEWALLLSADTASKVQYPKDQSTVMLLGDAGTAVLLHKKNSEYSIVNGLLGTDGFLYSAAILPAGGFRNMNVNRKPFVTEDGNERTNYHYSMRGLDIFSYAMTDIPKAFNDFFSFFNTSVDCYDGLLLHQANKMIISRLAKKLKADPEKVPICLENYGNTSSPAIPLTMCDSYAGKRGVGHFLACGFGTGLSYGITSFFVDMSNIFPVIETDEIFSDNLIR